MPLMFNALRHDARLPCAPAYGHNARYDFVLSFQLHHIR